MIHPCASCSKYSRDHHPIPSYSAILFGSLDEPPCMVCRKIWLTGGQAWGFAFPTCTTQSSWWKKSKLPIVLGCLVINWPCPDAEATAIKGAHHVVVQKGNEVLPGVFLASCGSRGYSFFRPEDNFCEVFNPHCFSMSVWCKASLYLAVPVSDYLHQLSNDPCPSRTSLY